eukprot:10544316-Heterocapsa_arctica.AAC.1
MSSKGKTSNVNDFLRSVHASGPIQLYRRITAIDVLFIGVTQFILTHDVHAQTSLTTHTVRAYDSHTLLV